MWVCEQSINFKCLRQHLYQSPEEVYKFIFLLAEDLLDVKVYKEQNEVAATER